MDYAAWIILPCHLRWVVKGSVGFIPVLKDGAFSLILRNLAQTDEIRDPFCSSVSIQYPWVR